MLSTFDSGFGGRAAPSERTSRGSGAVSKGKFRQAPDYKDMMETYLCKAETTNRQQRARGEEEDRIVGDTLVLIINYYIAISVGYLYHPFSIPKPCPS